MGCSSSKAAAGEAPDGVRKGPTQEEMVKANSPHGGATPSGVAPGALHNRTTSAVVPIMPVLATDGDAPAPTTNPLAATTSLSASATAFLHSPSSRTSPPSQGAAAAGSPTTMSNTLPPSSSLPPPSLASISRSLPAPLPPVKPGHSRPLSVTVRPAGDASGSGSPYGTMTGEQSAKLKTMGSSASRENSNDGSAKGSAAMSRQQSFNSLLNTASPSLNLADPAFTSTRIGDTFTHYARKRYEQSSHASSPERAERGAGEEETIDKKALAQLATDCVLSFLALLRQHNAAKWKDDKLRDKKERELRAKYTPGASLEDAVEIARYYLQAELQYKHGAITRTMFFYHFARCHRALFSYEKLTVEREALVQKWNATGSAKLDERRRKEKDGKEGKEGREHRPATADSEHSLSRKESKQAAAKEKKRKKKNRATAPANSISDLMQSTNSKVMQAEKKLTSTISATTGDKQKTLTLRKSTAAEA